MIPPDLLQPVAEIDDVVERGPILSFAKGNEAANNRLESAKIQSQKKSKDGRHGDRQQNERRRGKRAGSDQIKDNSDSGQDEDQQACDLDKNIDQHTRDSQTGGNSELAQKPRADEIAADHGERKQCIDRFTDEPQADKHVRSGPRPRRYKRPADAGTGQRDRPGGDDERCGPLRLGDGRKDRSKAVIGDQTREQRQAQ